MSVCAAMSTNFWSVMGAPLAECSFCADAVRQIAKQQTVDRMVFISVFPPSYNSCVQRGLGFPGLQNGLSGRVERRFFGVPWKHVGLRTRVTGVGWSDSTLRKKDTTDGAPGEHCGARPPALPHFLSSTAITWPSTVLSELSAYCTRAFIPSKSLQGFILPFGVKPKA